MKKIIIALLIVATMLSFFACGEKTPDPNPDDSQTVNGNKTPDPTPDPDDGIPDYVMEYYTKLNEIATNNNLNFTAEKPYDYDSLFFVIKIQGTGDLAEKTINLKWTKKQDYFKSTFYIDINPQVDAPLFKEVCTSVILINDNIELSEAKQKTQDFINSYKSDEYSDIIKIGEYVVFIQPAFSGATTTVFFEHKDSGNLVREINKEEYKPVDYATAQAAMMNVGEKFYFKGTVESEDKSNQIYSFIVSSDDGHKYSISCAYGWDVGIGNTYEIYASLTSVGTKEVPHFSLDSMELVD